MSLRFLFSVSLLASAAAAQTNPVLVSKKISATQGGFTGSLANGDLFGWSVCPVGDLDLDGVVDIAVGAPGDQGAGIDRGAVWILFLRAVGNPVKSAVKIDETLGGFFPAGLRDHARFGTSVSLIGDLSGDGFPELAVGAPGNHAASPPLFGAVYLLSLNATGGVAGVSILSSGVGGIPAILVESSDLFGESVAGIGDLDGNGVPDIAIGRGNRNNFGYIYIVRLEPNGTTQHVLRVGQDEGGFDPEPNVEFASSLFGSALSTLGDLDEDGVLDLFVGEAEYGGPFPGQYWVLSLEPLGSVVNTTAVTGYEIPLGGCCGVGKGVARIGDVDGDGVADMLVGAPGRGYYPDPDNPIPISFRPQTGAAMVVLLNTDGTPKDSTEISSVEGNLGFTLDPNDHFGTSTSALGDLDEDGVFDAVAGTPHDDDGGTDRGAIYLLHLDGYAFPSSATVYNGSHANALCFASATTPSLGTTWDASVDASGHPGATVDVLIVSLARRPPGTFVLGGDELLVQSGASLVGTSLMASSGGVDTFHTPIPANMALFGVHFWTQTLILGGGNKELCNALELLVQN